MPIQASDIEFRLSVNSAGPGDSGPQTDPDLSLGGFVSTTSIVDATLHNLFDVITGDENAAGDVEYRLIFVVNNHDTLTWQDVKVWIQSETAGGANAAIALDDVGVTSLTSATAQSEIETGEGTPPTGETFSSPTDKASGLSVGNVAPNSVFGLWIRRTATNSAAQDLDGVVIRAEGDTAA